MADKNHSAGSQSPRTRGGGDSHSHNSKLGNNTLNTGEGRRFPDYILCGSLNLHKSAENAAALAKHIAKQWDFLRINRNGIISTAQLELNRDPARYGSHKEGKPLSVTEWRKIEKDKLNFKGISFHYLSNNTTSNSQRKSL